MPSGYCGARCEGREAGVIFGGDKVTRGDAKIHGRHAVPPLPNLIQGTWGHGTRTNAREGTRGQGERQRYER